MRSNLPDDVRPCDVDAAAPEDRDPREGDPEDAYAKADELEDDDL